MNATRRAYWLLYLAKLLFEPLGIASRKLDSRNQVPVQGELVSQFSIRRVSAQQRYVSQPCLPSLLNPTFGVGPFVGAINDRRRKLQSQAVLETITAV